MDIADPASTEAAVAANAGDLDSPVRILVQTQTHLVPGDRFTEFGERYDAMVDLVCRHVCSCWFLIDHHGPDPSPPPEPPIIWHRWTGTEFVILRDRLPGRVRRELRHYPFWRVAYHLLVQEFCKEPSPRLRSNLGFTEELLRFVQDCPDGAEWVKARVPPEAWARLEDRLEIRGTLEPKEGDTRTRSSGQVKHPES
ncbi:hypothetical protein C8A05DRAFT_47159 [Staphylotrichum tortipilum]|uniref:Uncharacterized protein n=1 Tax=Staphylotrichum tortipilum TaxID=2831512 RepID=A0AAN6MD15_9PEZI|nr:hypothetical protein C8A05DRAFT_47159 [Staphylotrichum longicolle]